jgi:predicted nucleic acid-binding protein
VLEDLHERGETLTTHNYIVVETSALVRQRLGAAAERALHDDVLPVIAMEWVDHDLHNSAVTALLAGRRRASLVDWVSFELMRKRGIGIAFTFDRDFRLQGFRTVP